MALEFPKINIGNAPNDGTGDCLRLGGSKINQNFIVAAQELAVRVTSYQVKTMVALPRAEYTALETKDAYTMYIITD
jgi:hypothetical protein